MFIPGTIAALLAYFVKGLSGFGNTLVFSSVLSFFTANRSISPIDLLLGLPSNLYIVWRERKGLRLRVVLPLIAMLLLGMIPGAYLLRQADEQLLKRIMGLVIILLAVEMLLRNRHTGPPQKTNPLVLAVIGLVSGLLCGLFGIGAFLVAYVSRTTETSSEMRGNLCLVFLVENVVRGVMYARLGLLTGDIVRTVLMLVPGMALGLCGGLWASKKLPEARIRQITIILLLLMGLSVFLSNL